MSNQDVRIVVESVLAECYLQMPSGFDADNYWRLSYLSEVNSELYGRLDYDNCPYKNAMATEVKTLGHTARRVVVRVDIVEEIHLPAITLFRAVSSCEDNGILITAVSMHSSGATFSAYQTWPHKRKLRIPSE